MPDEHDNLDPFDKYISNDKDDHVDEPSDNIDSYIDDVSPSSTPTDIDEPPVINTMEVNMPTMILVGPGNVGKTVTLLRFARHLLSQQCTVSVNEEFVTGDSYKKNVAYFKDILYDQAQKKPKRNALGNYLLLDVFHHSKPVFQILEAPGEDFFSVENKERNQGFQEHINIILSSEQPKIYTFFFTKKMFPNDSMRIAYDARINDIFKLYFNPDRGDQIILLYNKIDEYTNLIDVGGVINEKRAYQDLVNKYPLTGNAIESIRTNYPKTKILFTPFSSGTFSNDKWQQGPEKYPKKLWAYMLECIPSSPGNPNIKAIAAGLGVVLLIVLVLLITQLS